MKNCAMACGSVVDRLCGTDGACVGQGDEDCVDIGDLMVENGPRQEVYKRFTAVFEGQMGLQVYGPTGDNVGEVPLIVSSVAGAAASNGVKVNDRIIAINDEPLVSVSAMEFANKVAVAKLDGPVKITFEKCS